MQMINTVMNETPKFLDGKPNELDKVIVKRAYATYLNDNGFTPEQFENEPFNMSELLPALGKLDTKWK